MNENAADVSKDVSAAASLAVDKDAKTTHEKSGANSIEKPLILGAVFGANRADKQLVQPAQSAPIKPSAPNSFAPSWLNDVTTKARKLGANARITPYSSNGLKYWRYREFINGKPKLDHIGPDRPMRSKGGITDEQRREYQRQVKARRARKRRRAKG